MKVLSSILLLLLVVLAGCASVGKHVERRDATVSLTGLSFSSPVNTVSKLDGCAAMPFEGALQVESAEWGCR